MEAYISMGLCYEDLKLNSLAITAYRMVIVLEPKGVDADLARAGILRLFRWYTTVRK